MGSVEMEQPLPKQQFYRRKLPDTCINFSSPKGKQLFQESMSAGYMECYFKLASQFRTQDEPAFCGLTTLVMVLNSLEVDPGMVWKAPWRWYHESMLDCCTPLHIIEKDGIDFDQFVCLANCNGLETGTVRADVNASEDEFRKKVQEYTRRDDSFLVLSYSRKVLNQTGDGHFSPVGAYHPEEDVVLMLDTARFKYPPHWIPLPLLWESMKSLDKSTGKPRGYVTMSRLDQNPLLLLFRISDVFSIYLPRGCTKGMLLFVETWQEWLSQRQTSAMDDMEKSPQANSENLLLNNNSLEMLIKVAILALQKSLGYLELKQSVLTTRLDINCEEDISQQHKCAIYKMINELETLNIFQLLTKILQHDEFLTNLDKAGQSAFGSINDLPTENAKCGVIRTINLVHYVTILLLCWPYHLSPVFTNGTNGYFLNTLLSNVVSSGTAKLVADEVMLLRKQLSEMLTFCGRTNPAKKCACKS